jgi:hypothetical protein
VSTIPNPDRRRRGNPQDRVLPATPALPIPKLPAGCGWPARQRAWWKSVWSSPLAAEWDPVLDFEAVFRLGSLYIATEKRPASAAVLAQMARLESELGLSPAARKRMYVRLPRRNASPVPDDRWERLRVTDPYPNPNGSRPRLRDVDPSEIEHE